MSDRKLIFPSQQQPYTGSRFKTKQFDYGKALEQWKAMNDAENERRAKMGTGTQSLPINAINNYHEQQLEP